MQFVLNKLLKISLLLAMLIALNVNDLRAQQIVDLSPVGGLDVPADCMVIELGEMVTFNRNINCGPNTEIWKLDETGQTLIFSSDKLSSSYTFEEEG